MAKPILVVVGSCTSTSANLLAVFPKNAANTASLKFRISGASIDESVSVPLVSADPYSLAYFKLSNLPASDSGTRIEYAIASGPESGAAGEFYSLKLLPQDLAQFRFALISCNGAFLVSNSERRYALWNTLAEKVRAGAIDLIIHAGDQVYADAIRMRHHLKVDNRVPPMTQLESLTSEYRKLYVQTWCVPEVANVLASCPSIMMWDDHDIYDGYGSRDDDGSVSAQVLYAAAQKTFREFQASGNPEPFNNSSHAFALRVGSVAFVILDGRQNRMWTAHRVLGAEQLAAIQQWLASDAAKNLSHLFIVSAIPLVYVPVVGYLKFIQTLRWDAPFTEDLRDSWSAPNNQQECKRLLDVIFAFADLSPQTHITVLSGDVHVGSLGTISSPGESRKISQIVSSGIGSPPPSGLGALLLRLVVDEKVKLPGSEYVGCLIRIPEIDRCVIARRNFVEIKVQPQSLDVRFLVERKVGIVELRHTLR